MQPFNRFANKKLVISIFFLGPIFFAAIFAPYLSRYPPLQTGVGPELQPPSLQFIMGTDQLGEDIFSQVIFGARVALFVGLTSSIMSVGLAFLLGLISGYFGGWVDETLMRLADVVLSIPSFIFIVFVIILFGSTLATISVIIGLVSWPSLARIVRSQVLSLKEREFIIAARCLGASSWNILIQEIFPNIGLAIIPSIALQIGYGALTEAALSFLGLGDPNVASWGRTLSLASTGIFLGDWWSVLFPGIALVMMIIGLSFLSDFLILYFGSRHM
jgi:peptide/nickel transport system permease protein